MNPGPVQWLKLFGYASDLKLNQLASAAVDPRPAVQLMQDFHGASTVGKADGWIGPKTLAAINNRICLHPDLADPELSEAEPERIARFLFGNEALTSVCLCVKKMHTRLLAATGNGSWPAGCHPTIYPTRHCVTYFVHRDSFPDHYKRPVTGGELNEVLEAGTWGVMREQLFGRWAGKPLLDVALWMMSESFRKSGAAHVEVDDRERADIIIRSLFIPGPTIGLGWFPDGTCRDVVEFHIDNSYRPGLMALAWLLTHECGHCNRCPHTFANQSHHRGIMSYSPKYPFEGISLGKAPYTIPRDPTVALLMRFYGSKDGDPVPVPPLMPPIEPPKGIALPLRLEYWNSDNDAGLARVNEKLVLVQVRNNQITYQEF